MEQHPPAQEVEMPKGFISVEQVALQTVGATISIIGMVFDFLPPSPTSRSDYQCVFSLRDSSVCPDTKVKFFKPLSELPAVQGLGDIVIVRLAKLKIYNGEKVVLSSHSTSWTVCPLQEPPSTSTPNERNFYSISLLKTRILPAEIAYVRYLRSTIPHEFTIRPAISGNPTADTAIASSALPPSLPRKKFCLIREIEPDRYYDILGQVVKIHQSAAGRIDLCVTDYTVNRLLYNHEWEGASGERDGDEYGYTDRSSSKWPGPHGKRVINVTLWEPHMQFAAEQVKLGDFVFLRNVHMKLTSSGMLEGKLHEDKLNPDKILISRIRDKTDVRVIGVLERRSEYRASLSKAQKEFLKLLESSEVAKATAKVGAKQNGKARKKPKGSEQKEKINFAKNISNYITCAYSSHALTPLATILSPPQPPNTPPFQNLNYRAAVRVVDFFPPALADFAVPRVHQPLSDYSDSDASSTSPTATLTQHSAWEWRFYLLVEDAQDPTARMRLLVAGPDAEYLLKLDAEDLRQDKAALSLLEEKMFFVWGELYEVRRARGGKEEEKVRNTPFECCVKEYGVRVESEGGEGNWERRFRMFGTTIR